VLAPTAVGGYNFLKPPWVIPATNPLLDKDFPAFQLRAEA